MEITKDGKVRQLELPTGDGTNSDNGTLGDVYQGTWKKIGGNKYRFKVKNVWDNYDMDFVAKVKSLTKLATEKGKNWDADTWSRVSMPTSKFDKLFKKTSRAVRANKEKAAARLKSSTLSEATNISSSDDSNSNSDSENPNADPEEIGIALYQHVFNTDDEPEYCEQSDGKWNVGQGTADSTIPFTINGDTVTYWTQKDGEATANGKNQENTISIDSLLGN